MPTIRMTLTGPFENKTKLFGKYQFVKGVHEFTGNDVQVQNVAKYFVRSYQVKVEKVEEAEVQEIEEVGEDKIAIRVDDSDVLSDEQVEADEENETDPPQPNARQVEIIAAVNRVEKDKWVDLQSETPRPTAKAIKDLTDDPTITVPEIVEVIKTWLS